MKKKEKRKKDIKLFTKSQIKRKQIKKIISNEENNRKLSDEFKESIDSRYLKFISLNKSNLILKANKKLRDMLDVKGIDKAENYILTLVQNTLLKGFNITINMYELELITDIYMEDDNKIYVKF